MNPVCKAHEQHEKRCWDVGVLAKYLKTPMFVAQNAVDGGTSNALRKDVLELSSKVLWQLI